MKLIILFISFVLINSCALPEFEPPTQKTKEISIKVINYNLWHGLSLRWFKMKELHSDDYKQARFKEQLHLLKKESPDILFLQEMNPVLSQSKKIAKELKSTYVFQETNCGMSLLGLNIPINLNAGLSIFVKPPLKIKKIIGLRLSGPIGFCNPYISFQYAEFRYALFALVHHPLYGSFFAINTHLHHTQEKNEEINQKIQMAKEEGIITSSQAQEIKNSIKEGNLRREQELKNIFIHLKELRKSYGDLPLILAGDFNFTVQSEAYKRIIQKEKLTDSAGAYSPTPYTWDSLRNKKNHSYNKNFKPPIPLFGKPELKNFFVTQDSKRRRIDYIFVNSHIETLSHSLFANKANSEGTLGSDHFGELVFIKLKK